MRRARRHGLQDGQGRPLHSRLGRIEQLEERTLLSIGGLELAGPLLGRAEVTRGSLEILTEANSGSAWVDNGESYWAGDRSIGLLRALDEIVVDFGDELPLPLNHAGSILAGKGLSGLTPKSVLGASKIAFSASARNGRELDAILSRVAHLPTVAWAAPTFINSQTGLRQWPNDAIVVALESGVDSDLYFSQEAFLDYRPLAGTADQFVVTVAGGFSGAVDLANRLPSDARVAWASVDFLTEFRPEYTPNDLLYAGQWHLNNTGQTGARIDADVDAPEAWDTTFGGNDIVVAVIDDAVQTDHPDLSIWTNSGEIPGNGIDDDGNGYIDDVNGWDVNGNDNDPNPGTIDENHGTSVAGVAAAAGNNGQGVTGAAGNVQIMPVRLGRPAMPYSSFAEAIYYAAGRTKDGLETWRGADVINMSWSIPPDPILDAAFDWAATNGREGRGIPMFAATGNAASGYRVYQHNLDASWGSREVIFEWKYSKDKNGTDGDDTVWLGLAAFPDGTIQRFDTLAMPGGWSTSGNVAWSIVDDPAHAYGTGRYQAKAGTIKQNQTTVLLSPTITVPSGGGSLVYLAWTSSEAGNDVLSLRVKDVATGQWDGPYAELQASGVPAVTTVISYPASHPATIAVGASTDWDYRSDYSQYAADTSRGTSVEIVAPSNGGFAGITTTDRTGAVGYDAGDYTSSFGGTSSATPLTAGVAALILSKNPDLTAAEVRQILRASADKIGGNNGAAAYDTDGFNSYYGYGRINANAALALTPFTSPFGRIQGTKWHDLDGDGTWDPGEPALSGWQIYLDINNDGQWDDPEPREVTDADGRYAFIDLEPGTYTVAEV